MGRYVKEITAASFHRNGIGGLGFHAILFINDEGEKMIASLFDAYGACAVYKVDELAKGNVEFARGNSFRGDVFENELRPMLEEFERKAGSNRAGPFSIIPADVISEFIAAATEKRP